MKTKSLTVSIDDGDEVAIDAVGHVITVTYSNGLLEVTAKEGLTEGARTVHESWPQGRS